MKHIKKFLESGEISYDLHRKIFDEIKDLKYLLEDEGYKVICVPMNKRMTLISINNDFEKISKLVSSKPEYYLEFIDRLDEFFEENNLKSEIYWNYLGVEISVYLK